MQFSHVLSLVNFFLSAFLEELYLVTEKFFFEITIALLHGEQNDFSKQLFPMLFRFKKYGSHHLVIFFGGVKYPSSTLCSPLGPCRMLSWRPRSSLNRFRFRYSLAVSSFAGDPPRQSSLNHVDISH